MKLKNNIFTPKGAIRQIDRLGRIVVPKEFRDSENWRQGDEVEMLLFEEGVLLIKKK